VKTSGQTEAAETLALEGLAFIASSETELTRFVESTGIDPGELRARAGERGVLCAVLNFLLADDERLLAFCAAHGVEARDVHFALHTLDDSR
jgi:hypothetical protein